jgi:hypothetical protein
MDRIHFSISPNMTKSVNICRAEITVCELILFTSVRVHVILFDENDKIQDVKQYLIKDDEYEAWSNDDNYLVNLIQQKIRE